MGAEMAEHEADFEKLVKLRKQQNEEFKKREHEQQIMIAEMANMQAALKQHGGRPTDVRRINVRRTFVGRAPDVRRTSNKS